MIDVSRPDLTIGVIGVGAMGRGIAQIAAAAGLAVRLLDSRPNAASEARADIMRTFDMLAGKGRMSRQAVADAAERLQPVGGEHALADCHIVIEAIIEDLKTKQALFASLEPVVAPDCLLATNTSSLSVTAIAARCKRPGRVGGFHFFNPVPLMKVVEVVEGALTEKWVGDALTALARRVGHEPVRAADTPGFIVNHAGRGFGTEALRIIQDGVTTFDEIDRILREQAGFRMGPCELLDLTGLDVSFPVMESIYEQFFQEPRFRPSYLLRQRVAAGLLGRKVGRGFYVYKDGKQVPAPAPPTPTPKHDPIPVWIGAMEEGWRQRLTEIVKAASWPLDEGSRAAENALCLVAPLGDDATTASLAQKLDARRTVAVDMAFPASARRVFMTTPVTAPESATAAHALLAADGTAVSRLRDSPGFVAQRVVATIANIGCEIAQQRIATPADIDNAVRLGLGYPKGPLALGDAFGPTRLLEVLRALQARTGDPRYRPSLWLARRAELGISLLTPES